MPNKASQADFESLAIFIAKKRNKTAKLFQPLLTALGIKTIRGVYESNINKKRIYPRRANEL